MSQVDKAIRKLGHLNNIIIKNRARYPRMTFPYASLLNNFRTVDHWRAYFEGQPNHYDDVKLLMTIPELAGFSWDFWIEDGKFWSDDTSPENFFYIDLIKICPILAEYLYCEDLSNGVRAMIKRLFETKNGFNFMNELSVFNLTTSDAFKIAYFVDLTLTEIRQKEIIQPKVYEPKKTRSGKVY
jgi:hypothetical protein